MAIRGFLELRATGARVHESCFRYTSQWTLPELCQRLQLQASPIGMNVHSQMVILVVALAVSTS
jgi:hypothetical protein